MGRNAHANGAGVLIRAEKTSIHAGDAIRDVLIELLFSSFLELEFRLDSCKFNKA